MKHGRPAPRSDIVDQFDADPQSKERARLQFQTIFGELSVRDACQKLGIGQARFFELRNTMMEAILQSQQSKPAGRPPRQLDPKDYQIHELQQQLTDARVHLAAAQIREEIALAIPHVSNRHPRKAKKKRHSGHPATHTTPRIAETFQITSPIQPTSEASTPGSSDT